MEYNWPLSVPQFSSSDKFKLVKYLLTDDRWTHGKMVEKFEAEMAKYIGAKYAVFTSSGSTANTILAMMLKDKNETSKTVVLFPSTTWITSVSPFIREGFSPQFIDINVNDFSIDLNELDKYLTAYKDSVACVFVTSLIGFTPNINELDKICKRHNVRLMMDNCENTLGKYGELNVSASITSTTSTYFGHQIQSIEGGFIFTNDINEYDYFLLARNHGMLRHLPVSRMERYRNPNVDALFDFAILGNNFRNTNINAFLGSCDLKRADEYFKKRRYLYDIFSDKMWNYLILPQDNLLSRHAPFCLPIIPTLKYASRLPGLKDICDKHKIERRPIISGNLLRQTCLLRSDFKDFKNSEYLHQNGFYVGLHNKTTKEDVNNLCSLLKSVIFE